MQSKTLPGKLEATFKHFGQAEKLLPKAQRIYIILKYCQKDRGKSISNAKGF